MPAGTMYATKPRSSEHSGRGRKLKSATKGRPKQRKNAPMRKTSKRGAYAPAKKKQMAIRRAPLVETFKYQSYPSNNKVQYLSRTIAYNNVVNDAFIAGFRQNLDIPNDGISTTSGQGPTCRGRDVYMKLTAMKLKFTFPENIYSIRSTYTPPEVIHGWVKKTMFKTSLTVPTPGNVNRDHFLALINAELTGQFNENNDNLDFADRRPTQYKILGRRKIFPNRNASITNDNYLKGVENIALPTSGASTAPLPGGGTEAMSVIKTLPPVFHTVRWSVNRKVGLQQTEVWSGTGGNDTRFYPADTWIPFCIVFNPSFAAQINDPTADSYRGQIACANNSVLYYTDS